MNKDGEFVCDDHKPEKADGQYWVDASELNGQCDHCKNTARFYVLEQLDSRQHPAN